MTKSIVTEPQLTMSLVAESQIPKLGHFSLLVRHPDTQLNDTHKKGLNVMLSIAELCHYAECYGAFNSYLECRHWDLVSWNLVTRDYVTVSQIEICQN